jgi:hypothetical protein
LHLCAGDLLAGRAGLGGRVNCQLNQNTFAGSGAILVRLTHYHSHGFGNAAVLSPTESLLLFEISYEADILFIDRRNLLGIGCRGNSR